MNRLPSFFQDHVLVPVETIVVDCNGRVLFSSGDITSSSACSAHSAEQESGTSLNFILSALISPEEYRELAALLNDPGTRRFRKDYGTTTQEKTITITGSPMITCLAERQWLLTIQDVSSCHALNRRLATLEGGMTERRVNEIKLLKAKELAESTNEAKSDFLANMSHELRTPLHAILSYANYGEKKIESAERSELLRFFRQIAASGRRLIPLIDSLLDLSRLEAGGMHYNFQSHELIMEIESAINELTPLAEQKDMVVRIIPPDAPTTAFFDPGRIGQVIRNLLGNGIKFSDPNTTITVAFSREQKRNNRTMLQTTISNYGVGIPAGEFTSIFDKFAQSSKTKSGAGGTGLGLAICRQIIEDHCGSIWVDTGSDGATRFHFTLPLKKTGENIANSKYLCP